MADALEYIYLGTVDNDGTGDDLKTAGGKINNLIRRTISRNIPKSADFNLTAENCNDFIICDTTSADITVTFKLEDESTYLYLDNSTVRFVNSGDNDLILEGEVDGEDSVTIIGNFVIGKYCVVDIRYLGDDIWIVDNSSVNPIKAAGSDIDTGTDDAKYVTSKAIADSNIGKAIVGGREITDASDDLESTDVGTVVNCNKATPQTLTIPLATFTEGEVVGIIQVGAGQTTIAVADGAKQTISTACKSAGVDCMMAIWCYDDTTNAEVYKIIGGVV